MLTVHTLLVAAHVLFAALIIVPVIVALLWWLAKR